MSSVPSDELQRAVKRANHACNQPFPDYDIATYKAAGKTFRHIKGQRLIEALNESFGPLAWSYEALEVRRIHQGERKGKWDVAHMARVRLWLHPEGRADHVLTEVTEIGVDDGRASKLADALNVSAKGAVTIGVKRAAKCLGPRYGLALYFEPHQRGDMYGQPQPYQEQQQEQEEARTKKEEELAQKQRKAMQREKQRRQKEAEKKKDEAEEAPKGIPEKRPPMEKRPTAEAITDVIGYGRALGLSHQDMAEVTDVPAGMIWVMLEDPESVTPKQQDDVLHELAEWCQQVGVGKKKKGQVFRQVMGDRPASDMGPGDVANMCRELWVQYGNAQQWRGFVVRFEEIHEERQGE